MWGGVSARCGHRVSIRSLCGTTDSPRWPRLSVDPGRWQIAFTAVLDVIESRFARYEPLRHAAGLMAGMPAPSERKNCWTIAERRGDVSPDGLQHLLARAKWDANAVRDDLRGYVLGAFADEQAVLIVDETGDVKKGVERVGVQRQYTGIAVRSRTPSSRFISVPAPCSSRPNPAGHHDDAPRAQAGTPAAWVAGE